MKAVLLALFCLTLPLNVLASTLAELGTWRLMLSEEPGQDNLPPGMGLQKMFTLTTDRDSNVYDLHAMLDSRNLSATGMYIRSAEGGRAFLLTDIEKPSGVTLFETQGRKVLILQGNLNRDTNEGRLHLKYLANGLSMTYETCDVILRRTGNQYWVQNAYTNAKITAAKVLTYWAGVTTIQGICPNKGF
jgi:hypothetical protein